MNPDLVDLEKLASCARECLAAQTPEVRAELEEMIAAGPIDVVDDTGGFVVLSIEGTDFGRVHRSRLLRVMNPDAN